jgi:hypothetical protein
MYMYIYINTYECIYVYMNVYICIYMKTYIHIYKNIYIGSFDCHIRGRSFGMVTRTSGKSQSIKSWYVYIYIYLYICMYIYMCIYMSLYIFIDMYIYKSIYTYIHIDLKTLKKNLFIYY